MDYVAYCSTTPLFTLGTIIFEHQLEQSWMPCRVWPLVFFFSFALHFESWVSVMSAVFLTVSGTQGREQALVLIIKESGQCQEGENTLSAKPRSKTRSHFGYTIHMNTSTMVSAVAQPLCYVLCISHCKPSVSTPSSLSRDNRARIGWNRARMTMRWYHMMRKTDQSQNHQYPPADSLVQQFPSPFRWNFVLISTWPR